MGSKITFHTANWCDAKQLYVTHERYRTEKPSLYSSVFGSPTWKKDQCCNDQVRLRMLHYLHPVLFDGRGQIYQWLN